MAVAAIATTPTRGSHPRRPPDPHPRLRHRQTLANCSPHPPPLRDSIPPTSTPPPPPSNSSGGPASRTSPLPLLLPPDGRHPRRIHFRAHVGRHSLYEAPRPPHLPLPLRLRLHLAASGGASSSFDAVRTRWGLFGSALPHFANYLIRLELLDFSHFGFEEDIDIVEMED
ncbi:uncharacterized protein A4U43_C08F8380 [Asparagus officinalis]|nr:uncharacterized protein A4U43_C08F8380 [Asparagus officinalis]